MVYVIIVRVWRNCTGPGLMVTEEDVVVVGEHQIVAPLTFCTSSGAAVVVECLHTSCSS